MNLKIGATGGGTSLNRTDLLACCSYLAENTGERSFAEKLLQLEECSGPAAKRDTLKKIIEVARHEGLQTLIFKPKESDWHEIIKQLPAIIEFRNGRYLIVSGIEISPDGALVSLTLIDRTDGCDHCKYNFSFTEFQKHSTGGLLRFAKINTALVCFSIVAKEHNIELTQERLQHEYNIGHEEVAQETLLRMSKDHGLRAKVLKLDWSGLMNLNKAYPAIARLESGRHVVVVGAIGDNLEQQAIACYDPLSFSGGGHLRMTREEFVSLWTGEIFILKRVYKLRDETQPFSLRWFIPEILRQKTAFVDIAFAVLFINVIALVTPVFFQIVIDKVLVNEAFTTLQVLGVGMTAMLIVNGCLDFLRDYLLLHATNKIDLRVTSRTFRHMLNLPLDFFEKVTAGVLTKHMQQTANIRGFLTGSVFLTMLEATSLFIFLPFLFFYSFQLTAIVLVFTLLIAAVILVLIAPFKRRLNALYDAEGDRQAMLVETINGMPTVKAMAIEPLLRGQWEQKVARAISMQFRVGKISITAKSLTQFLERLMTVILIWVGASQVFSGLLTIGALIAFQMLAGRVTSPLVRLVGLIHQYQEAALSVEKLGMVMNAKPERGTSRHGTRPSLKGDIVLDRVNFRYAPGLPDALKELSLTIPAGTTLGIVGPSGSGKTTLTRLLQKAYFPSSGTIRINNCYLNEIDTAYLRRNTGVVLQESFLFKATVAENIRAGQAGATREQIIEAAILAGADEFIVKLPQGYDTLLEEGASNMSGGQRQRLAIARALLTHPEILILDEATSSLDPESERIVRENLAEISRGRTVLIVSHRLSMLKDADRTIVLEDGNLVSYGSHNSLLQGCRLYQKLWRQQMEFK
jgi:ATP-binding cassette, subfamily B, bacterial HlyB/CyaB